MTDFQTLLSFVDELRAFAAWLIANNVTSKADLKRKYRSSGLTQVRALQYYEFLQTIDEIKRGLN